MKKTLLSAVLGAALFVGLTSIASADPLRDAYEGQCRDAARSQLRGKAGPRVVDRLCECAADRAESSGWVLPEFPARDAGQCLDWARGLLSDSPFARLSLPAASPRPEPMARLPRRAARPAAR